MSVHCPTTHAQMDTSGNTSLCYSHTHNTAHTVPRPHPHTALFSVVSSARSLSLPLPLSHTHVPAEHLLGCMAHSRTPLSHELIGKAIKGSVGPASWRNVLFCYLASKLTKPVRSHLADAGWAIFIYFLLEKLDAGSQRCLASNNEAILRG